MALTKVIGSGIGTVTNQFVDGNMATGSVVQVVTASHSSRVDSTSTSYADTGLTCNITPSSSSNKILVICSQAIGQDRDTSEAHGSLKLLRDSTDIFESTKISGIESGGSAAKNNSINCVTVLDSPSSTSALTYKTQFKVENTGNNGASRAQWNMPSHIQLLEIVG
tara:strand:- start:301 stop:798 length:498 start_codon:yes stop_codon:yes gene_type:complete